MLLKKGTFRQIVQFMMAKGCVKQSELKEFFNSIRDNEWPTQMDEKFIFETISKINCKLNHYNMMIRSYLDEVTAEKYYVFISKVDNKITRAALHYTPRQFEFFKLIMQAIVQDSRGVVAREELDQLASKAGLKEFNNLYSEWLDKDWLMTLTDEGQTLITLGPRSMAELDVLIPSFAQVAASIVATRKVAPQR